jgi:hypothetical protein
MSIDERYLEWCKMQWAREVSSDFETLRALDGSAAWRLLEAIMTVGDRTTQIAVGSALIERRVLGTTSNVAQTFLGSVPAVSKREQRLDSEKREHRWNPVNRKELWRTIQRHPKFSVLGARWTGAPITERGGWFILREGRIEIQTVIDLGGSSRQMSYEQTVMVGGSRFLEHTSCLAWYGFTPATHWHFIGKGDEPRTADLLLRLIEIGIRELPQLV